MKRSANSGSGNYDNKIMDFIDDEDEGNYSEEHNEDDYKLYESDGGKGIYFKHCSSSGEVDIDHICLDKPRAQRRPPIGGKWSANEDNHLKQIVELHGPKNWKEIADLLGNTRTDVQCLHRWNKVLKPGLHKGAWTDEEDEILKSLIISGGGAGGVKWSYIASQLPGRIGKQCRERWFNHLDPNVVKSLWTVADDMVLYKAQKKFGNRWCEIAKMLPGRSENAVKNRWNSSTMRKWLRDNNLKPGTSRAKDGTTAREHHHIGGSGSDGDMNYSPSGHSSHLDEEGSPHSTKQLNYMSQQDSGDELDVLRTSDKRALKRKLKKMNQSGTSNARSAESMSSMSLMRDNDNSQGYFDHEKVEPLVSPNTNVLNNMFHSSQHPPLVLGGGNSGEGADNKSIGKNTSRMPAHLRPPGIITTSSNNSLLTDLNMPNSTTNFMLELFRRPGSATSANSGKYDSFFGLYSPNASGGGASSSLMLNGDNDSVFEDILRHGALLSPMSSMNDNSLFSPSVLSTRNMNNSMNVNSSANNEFFGFDNNPTSHQGSGSGTVNAHSGLPFKQKMKQQSPKYQPHTSAGALSNTVIDNVPKIPVSPNTKNELPANDAMKSINMNMLETESDHGVKNPPSSLSHSTSINMEPNQISVFTEHHFQLPKAPDLTISTSTSSQRSLSPTSRALAKLQQLLKEISNHKESKIRKLIKSTDTVPLQMLPYFGFLHEVAQSIVIQNKKPDLSLIGQLVERFQRTSYTPKYTALNTPRYGADMSYGMGSNQNLGESVDPNLFDKVHDEVFQDQLSLHEVNKNITSDTSHQKNKTVTIVESGNNHLDASTYSCATDPSSSSTPLFKKQKTSLEISSGATSISNFNDSAVDAAITVALQLITHSSSAEQILQVLTAGLESDEN